MQTRECAESRHEFFFIIMICQHTQHGMLYHGNTQTHKCPQRKTPQQQRVNTMDSVMAIKHSTQHTRVLFQFHFSSHSQEHFQNGVPPRDDARNCFLIPHPNFLVLDYPNKSQFKICNDDIMESK